jgi:hypothetical protein
LGGESRRDVKELYRDGEGGRGQRLVVQGLGCTRKVHKKRWEEGKVEVEGFGQRWENGGAEVRNGG